MHIGPKPSQPPKPPHVPGAPSGPRPALKVDIPVPQKPPASHPPTPTGAREFPPGFVDSDPGPEIIRFGGYKVESRAFQASKPQAQDIITEHSGENRMLIPPHSHKQTHDPATGQPIVPPRPGGGEAETGVTFGQIENPFGGGPMTYPIQTINTGMAGTTGLPTYAPDARMKHDFHSHPYSLGDFGGEHLTRPSKGDIRYIRDINSQQQKYHQAAVTGRTDHLGADELASWNALSKSEREDFKEKPARIEGYIQTPAPRSENQVTGQAIAYDPNTYIKYDENGRYHVMIPKPDPDMPTPPDTPVGGTPRFHHPTEHGAKDWPEWPPYTGGDILYPSSDDFRAGRS